MEDKKLLERIENIIVFKRKGSEARLILEALEAFGYRKLPEEKPPLLTREQVDEMEMWDDAIPEGSLTMEQVAEEVMIKILRVAKAQLDICIKYYEG